MLAASQYQIRLIDKKAASTRSAHIIKQYSGMPTGYISRRRHAALTPEASSRAAIRTNRPIISDGADTVAVSGPSPPDGAAAAAAVTEPGGSRSRRSIRVRRVSRRSLPAGRRLPARAAPLSTHTAGRSQPRGPTGRHGRRQAGAAVTDAP